MRPSWTLALAALAALGVGCTSDATTLSAVPTPTSLTLAPSEFLGAVPCGAEPGAMRSYVATIVDITTPDAPFTLPSSPPAPCSASVSFRYVVPGHTYRAEIDGYEAAADDLTPFGGRFSGARAMLSGGLSATPRWTGGCADDAATAAVAVLNEGVLVTGCHPLVAHTVSDTAIAVEFAPLLGQLGCSDVASLDVLADGQGPSATNLACSLGRIRFADTIVAGRHYAFKVTAKSASDTLTHWGANCTADAVEGLEIAATCDALRSTGEVRFDAAPLLDAAQIPCAGAYVTATVSGVSSVPTPCQKPLTMGPLPRGPLSATLTVTTPGAPSNTLLEATCTADVNPGETVGANCVQTAP